MIRARALGRSIGGLVLAAAALVTSGCVLAPVPAPVIGPPVVVAPRPVVVVPKRPHPYYRGGYYGYHRGHHRWAY
jgi:hypothetical protein